MNNEHRNHKKSSIVVRRTGKSIQIRRKGYKEKSVRLATIDFLAGDLDSVDSLLINNVERNKWSAEKASIAKARSRHSVESMLESGIDNQLYVIYRALCHLQKQDPAGALPRNKQLACRIWLIWGLIRGVISGTSSWHIQDKDARALLAHGDSGKANIVATLKRLGMEID